MNVHVKIPIKYRSDPIDPDVKSIIFDWKQDNVDKAYNQGQLMADVMDKLADFLDKLPDTAMIIQMSNIDMLHKKQEIINYLRRHDDQLSVTIFNENTVTQSKDGTLSKHENKPALQNDNQEKEEKMPEENTNTENVTAQKAQETNQDLAKTEFHRNYPLFVHVQKQGKHSYDPYDLNHQVPDDDDYINAIGISHIKRCQWKDIKNIVKNNINLIFKNPLGILPVNGSLTDNRRKTIAQNSGLDIDKVQNVESKNLGILESTENDNHQIIGKLVVLILKPMTSEPKTQNQKENEEKQALIDSEANDIKQAITEANNKDEKEQVNEAPQQKEKEHNVKMNNDLGNDIFQAFTPEGSKSNTNQSVQNNASNQTWNTAQNTTESQNPFEVMNQNNTQTFPTTANQSANAKLDNDALIKAMNDTADHIIARIDALKADLNKYQKTADSAFTLAAVANDVDTSDLPEQFIAWAKTQVKNDATRANAIFMITKEIQNPNPRGFCQELRDPSKFVRAVEYLSKETM